jgi:hypothetical protein
MTVSIKIRLGPMAEITAHGETCEEITKRLEGWGQLNETVEKLSVDLAERMYPEEEAGAAEGQEQTEEKE